MQAREVFHKAVYRRFSVFFGLLAVSSLLSACGADSGDEAQSGPRSWAVTARSTSWSAVGTAVSSWPQANSPTARLDTASVRVQTLRMYTPPQLVEPASTSIVHRGGFARQGRRSNRVDGPALRDPWVRGHASGSIVGAWEDHFIGPTPR